MSAEFIGESGPELTPPRKPRPYVRPAVPYVPGSDGVAKVRCKWCSSALGVLSGVFVCTPCDHVQGKPQHG